VNEPPNLSFHEIEAATRDATGPVWMAGFGELKFLHRENRRFEKIISAEFESTDEEDW
jgi:hypothetical protein